MRHLFILFLVSGLFAVNSHAQSSKESSEDVRLAIQENFREMGQAMAASDPELLAIHFTEDALLKFPGQKPINGRKAIAAAHNEMLKKGLMVKPSTTEVVTFGDTAYEIGTYEFVNSEGQKLDSGYYATIWKKIDGEWKIFRDVISSNGKRK